MAALAPQEVWVAQSDPFSGLVVELFPVKEKMLLSDLSIFHFTLSWPNATTFIFDQVQIMVFQDVL